MSQTITVRIGKDLAQWLDQTSRRTGVAQDQIVRDELKKAKAASSRPAFMKLAGVVEGPRDLSSRKGFATQ